MRSFGHEFEINYIGSKNRRLKIILDFKHIFFIRYVHRNRHENDNILTCYKKTI